MLLCTNMIHELITKGWEDYALIDSGNGARLEKFGKYLLNRPDPQIIWQPSLDQSDWDKADAVFEKTIADKGMWKTDIQSKWEMSYKNIRFYARLTPFKHTGVFPEQSLHWDWMEELIEQEKKTCLPAGRQLNILNLFGYTGIASLVAAAAGAKVTHVDASYPTIGWGRENQKLSGLEDKPIRWIEDDAMKFVNREIKRGVFYDGIIMDPPTIGHGPKGERWEFAEMFPHLMQLCHQLLSENPVFFLVNAYAISASSIMLQNVMSDYFSKREGTIESGELILESSAKRLLSTGIYTRWSKTPSSS